MRKFCKDLLISYSHIKIQSEDSERQGRPTKLGVKDFFLFLKFSGSFPHNFLLFSSSISKIV